METLGQTVSLLSRHWITENLFEVSLERPLKLIFQPGQHVTLCYAGTARAYSPVSTPEDPVLTLLLRKVNDGYLSNQLATVAIGEEVELGDVQGYLTYTPSERPTVFLATGTGIAPFISMFVSGVQPRFVCHGVRDADELYRFQELSQLAGYVPCVSGGQTGIGFAGRVTQWVQEHLDRGCYDFYLCGNSSMIQDMTLLVDECYPGSRIYCEAYF